MGRFANETRTPQRQEIAGVINGVGASRTMVIKVPPGATYSRLLLRAFIAGNAPTRVNFEAMLGEIRVLMNGVQIEALNAKQFIALAEYYNTGCVGDTGYIPFDFQRLWMQSIAAQNGPAWGTLGESSFEIQIDQAAASTIDNVLLYAETEPAATELGAFIRRVRISPAIVGVGVSAFGNLPFFPGSRLYAIHVECSTPANLTNARFACDDISQINLPVAVSNRFLLNATPGRTIQNAIRTAFDGTTSGFVHLDFASRNYDEDAIPMTYEKHVLEENFANAAPTVHNIIMEVGSIQPSRLKR